MLAAAGTDEIQLETEPRARLAPPPRWPPTALGAGALAPLSPRRQYLRSAARRRYVVVYIARRPSLLRTLITGVVLGAFVAITRLGPHPFALRGVVPMLAAGAVSGLVLASTDRLAHRPARVAGFALINAAGALGGAAWWLLARPPSSFLFASGLGAVLALGVVAFERWLQQAAG